MKTDRIRDQTLRDKLYRRTGRAKARPRVAPSARPAAGNKNAQAFGLSMATNGRNTDGDPRFDAIRRPVEAQ
jgi:hypothetical protein